MTQKPIAGIYYIKNIINNKYYIGQTNNTYNREKTHLSSFKNGKAVNDYLRKSIIKYGYENFKYKLFFELPSNKTILNFFEMFFIWILNTRVPNGYNINKGGDNKITQADIKRTIKKKIQKRKNNKIKQLKEKDFIIWNQNKNIFYLSFPKDYINKINNPTIELYKYPTGNNYNLHIEYITNDGLFSWWHNKNGIKQNQINKTLKYYIKIIPNIKLIENKFPLQTNRQKGLPDTRRK